MVSVPKLTFHNLGGVSSSSEDALHLPDPVKQPLVGILFDMDGTLVGSEFLAPMGWAAVLREVCLNNFST
eukprot:7233110-Pyramimonas_sp.AAC.2